MQGIVPQLCLLLGVLCFISPTFGLLCVHLENCTGSHDNCSKSEISRPCLNSNDFCFTFVAPVEETDETWRVPSARIWVFKGCANSLTFFPSCSNHSLECNDFGCSRCCPTDGCNTLDPRWVAFPELFRPTQPTSPPANLVTTVRPSSVFSGRVTLGGVIATSNAVQSDTFVSPYAIISALLTVLCVHQS